MKFPQAPQAIAKRVQIEKARRLRVLKKPPTTAPRFLAALKQLAPHDHYALAVSGGRDSMALVALAAAAEKTNAPQFHVVSVDHGLRKEARHEMRLVVETCRRVGLPHKFCAAIRRWAQAAFSRRRANCAIG